VFLPAAVEVLGPFDERVPDLLLELPLGCLVDLGGFVAMLLSSSSATTTIARKATKANRTMSFMTTRFSRLVTEPMVNLKWDFYSAWSFKRLIMTIIYENVQNLVDFIEKVETFPLHDTKVRRICFI
jgi:hypothetical protein